MVKQNWRYLLFLLASHHPKEKLNHTIRIGFRSKQIYLCSRCTGVAFGMAAIFVFAVFGQVFSLWLYLPLIAILPLTAIVDWFTQSAKKRESTTGIRLVSGFLLGTSEALALQLLIYGFYMQFLIAIGIALSYALSVYLIAFKTKCLDTYVNEMNQI